MLHKFLFGLDIVFFDFSFKFMYLYLYLFILYLKKDLQRVDNKGGHLHINFFHDALSSISHPRASHPSVNLKNLILLPFRVVNFCEGSKGFMTLRQDPNTSSHWRLVTLQNFPLLLLNVVRSIFTHIQFTIEKKGENYSNLDLHFNLNC